MAPRLHRSQRRDDGRRPADPRARRPDGTRLVPKALAWSPLGAGWRMCCKRRARNPARRATSRRMASGCAARRAAPFTWRARLHQLRRNLLHRADHVATGRHGSPGRGADRRRVRRAPREHSHRRGWPVWMRCPSTRSYTARSGRSTATRSSRLAAARAARRAGHAWRATAARRGRGAVAARRAAVRQRHGDVRRAARRKRQRRVALYLSAPGQDEPLAVTDALVDGGESIFCGDSMSRKRSSSPTTRRTRFTARRSSSTRKAPARPDAHPGRDRRAGWGPVVVRTDAARINTTDGEPLNLRSAPGGSLLSRCRTGRWSRSWAGRARSMACMVAGPRRRWRCGLGGRVGG